MNNKLSNIKTVEKLFSEHSSKPTDILLEAILNFFNKSVKNLAIVKIKVKIFNYYSIDYGNTLHSDDNI